MTKEELMKLNPYKVPVNKKRKYTVNIHKDYKEIIDDEFSRQYSSFNGVFVALLQNYFKNKDKNK